jgi:Sec-independent protein secretion pathway component TatC
MPYLLYEIWGFVAPGCKHEALRGPLVFSSIALFYSGMAFAVLPGLPGRVPVPGVDHARALK